MLMWTVPVLANELISRYHHASDETWHFEWCKYMLNSIACQNIAASYDWFSRAGEKERVSSRFRCPGGLMMHEWIITEQNPPGGIFDRSQITVHRQATGNSTECFLNGPNAHGLNCAHCDSLHKPMVTLPLWWLCHYVMAVCQISTNTRCWAITCWWPIGVDILINNIGFA